ncbi:MAG: hypothetical protein RIA69_11690 [Cyclobacteriaceae bacterium]
MKKIIIKITTVFGLGLVFVVPVMAQGAPPATPIDGGLSLLLVAGGAYGIKKVMDNRK